MGCTDITSIIFRNSPVRHMGNRQFFWDIIIILMTYKVKKVSTVTELCKPTSSEQPFFFLKSNVMWVQNQYQCIHLRHIIKQTSIKTTNRVHTPFQSSKQTFKASEREWGGREREPEGRDRGEERGREGEREREREKGEREKKSTF